MAYALQGDGLGATATASGGAAGNAQPDSPQAVLARIREIDQTSGRLQTELATLIRTASVPGTPEWDRKVSVRAEIRSLANELITLLDGGLWRQAITN